MMSKFNSTNISRHIKNIFEEDELNKKSVVANFATTAADGKTGEIERRCSGVPPDDLVK